MVSKKIIYATSLVVILGILSGIVSFNHKRPRAIETLNAHVVADSANIIVPDSGKISDIMIPDSQNIKKGQPIAELTIPLATQKNTQKANPIQKNKKDLEKDYEDAALKYKDGVISQDEYDKSIENIEAQQEAALAQNSKIIPTNKTVKVYSPIDGKIVWGNLKIGDTVNKDTTIAKVNSSYKEVLAHFSTSYGDSISIGSKANIKLIKYPDKQFTGIVNSIGTPDKKGLPIVIIFESEISDVDIENGDSAIVKLDR